MKTIGNKKYFVIEIDETTLSGDLCVVNIFINNRNICYDDDLPYLQSFTCSMEAELRVLKNIQEKTELRKYFEEKTVEQSHVFISSTRDSESENFDIENDELYLTYRVLNWSETTDNVTCFIIPYGNKFYLTYEFWRETHEVKSEIGLINNIQIEIGEIIEVIKQSIDQIDQIKRINKKLK